MMNIIKAIARFLLIAASLMAVPSNAQRTAKVSGKSTFIVSENDNVTLKEAKIKAIEMARTNAIKDEFGVLVASDFINSDRVVDDELSSFYIMNTASSVKGEWLGDDKEPVVKMEIVNGDIWFTAEVSGQAREIVRAQTDLKWQIQKNVDGHKTEADQFDSGERFFVKFKSPTDGYLAIYLITGDDETSCLLPYRKDTKGRFDVKGRTEYELFDKSIDTAASYYKLSTNQLQEYNQIVLIYSPNPFTKCMDESNDPRRPNTLSQKQFAEWLLKNQRADKDMVVQRKWLSIKGME